MRINNIQYNNIQPQLTTPREKVDFKEIKSVEQKGFVDLVNELLKWRENEKQLKNCPKWDLSKIPLKYFINNQKDNDKFLPEFVNTVQSAFLPWSRASSGLIRFERVYNESMANIIIDWTDKVTPGRTFEAGHANLKVINNKIEKAEIEIIILPAIDKFATDEQRTERVRRTALHEIGHTLGLNHSTNKKDIMFHRGITNKSLSQNDINRLVDLYKFAKTAAKFY